MSVSTEIIILTVSSPTNAISFFITNQFQFALSMQHAVSGTGSQRSPLGTQVPSGPLRVCNAESVHVMVHSLRTPKST